MKDVLRNTVIGAFAATALVSAGLAPLGAAAGVPDSAPVKARQAEKQKEMNLQVSHDGFEAMRNVRSARLALFNGDTDRARELVRQARQALVKAASDEHAMGIGKSQDANLVPIDGQLVVGQDYVGTPEKAAHLDKGGQHLKAGKTDEAIEQFRLAEEDIGYTQLLMPLKETRAHVDEAAGMIRDKNYFDANLALKAAEDGLTVDTTMLVDVPKPAKTAAASDTASTSTPTPPATRVD
ncbi:MAG: YfdX family protein [Rhodocyclaceae bacterium]|nr:YfdX family protein [Rhodocyclaceae bacterium]